MRLSCLAIVTAFLLPGLAAAQDQSAGDDAAVYLELNNMLPEDEVCRVVFGVGNGLSEQLAAATWQIAVFDTDNLYQNLLALSVDNLAPGKWRYLTFPLPYTCDSLGRFLVNGVPACTLAGSDAMNPACETQLSLTSRQDIVFD